MYPLPVGYMSSVSEIKTERGDFVGTGFISEIGKGFVKIISKDEQLSPLKSGTEVRLNAFNSKLGLAMLSGKVYMSTTGFIFITRLEPIVAEEKREFFRIETSEPCAIYKKVRRFTTGRELIDKQAYIENISIGGILIDAPETLALGDQIYVDTKVFETETTLYCLVVRIDETITPRQGRRKYGCSFLNFTERQKDYICRYVFEQQRLIMSKSRI